MPDSLEARIRTLERRSMRLSAIAAVLAVGFLLSILTQMLPRPAVDAQRFMLRDSTGAWRGALMMREDGSPVLRLNDARGKARLYGVVLPDGNARLRFTDSTGVHRAILELQQQSLPQLRLFGADGRLRAQVSVDAEGNPMAELVRGDEHRRIMLGQPSPATAQPGAAR